MRILFIRTDRMGDLLMALPAVHLLREVFPRAEISVLVQKGLASLLESHPDINRIFEWDPAKEAGWISLIRFSLIVRREKYDIAVISNPTRFFHVAVFLAGIPTRVGYRRKAGLLLNRSLPDTKAVRDLREFEYNLELVSLLGISKSPPQFFLPKRPEKEKLADEILCRNGFSLTDRPVALHPWTSNPVKEWKRGNFEELARQLTNHGQKVIVIGGEESRDEAARWIIPSRHMFLNLVGAVSLDILPSLLRHCSILVSNDSGPVHVAAAVATPVIVVAPEVHAPLLERWKPWGDENVILLSPSVEHVIEVLSKYALSHR